MGKQVKQRLNRFLGSFPNILGHWTFLEGVFYRNALLHNTYWETLGHVQPCNLKCSFLFGGHAEVQAEVQSREAEMERMNDIAFTFGGIWKVGRDMLEWELLGTAHEKKEFTDWDELRREWFQAESSSRTGSCKACRTRNDKDTSDWAGWEIDKCEFEKYFEGRNYGTW